MELRVKSCCCIPLRIGILIVAYFNVLLSWLLVVGSTLVMLMATPTSEVIQKIAVGIWSFNMIPTTNLVFSVVLVCGMHRNDPALLRVYYWYGIVAFGLSILLYSLIIPSSDAPDMLIIVIHLAYQAYVIILVKSVVFKIKQNQLDINKSTENMSVTDVEKSDATGF